jgi:hypothetical protein
MRRIKWFQHLAITALIGMNAFVFMSMRDVALGKNLMYTIAMVTISLLVISFIAYKNRPVKKRSANNPN